MRVRRTLVVLAIAAAGSLVACEVRSPTLGGDPAQRAASVAPAAMDTIVGSTVQFRVSSPAGYSWSWSSSDTTIAVVLPDLGFVLARRPGTATIFARAKSEPRLEGGAVLRVKPIENLGPVPPAAFTTDATGYIAYRIPGGMPRYQFRVVSRYENRGSATVYLARCYPDSPKPVFSVGMISGGVSGYAQVWACVGHDQQFAILPGSVRVDTLVIQGPNQFQGGTPIGATQGDFRLYYEVRLAPGDGAPPAPDSLKLSNGFRVRTTELPPP